MHEQQNINQLQLLAVLCLQLLLHAPARHNVPKGHTCALRMWHVALGTWQLSSKDVNCLNLHDIGTHKSAHVHCGATHGAQDAEHVKPS
jgi:hypothetical protein